MTKTYRTHRLNLAVQYSFKDELGRLRETTIQFVNGALSTDDEDEQKFIESLPTFKDETIYVEKAEDILAEAKAKAVALRAIADKAVAEAKAAEDAVANLVKSAPVPVAAPGAVTAAA